MSEHAEGYNHNVAQTKRLAECRRDGAALKSLLARIAKFEPDEKYAEPTSKPEPISLSGNLTLFWDRKQKEKVLGMMGSALEHEQRLANVLNEALSDEKDDGSGVDRDNALHRCAMIREILNKYVP